MRLRTSDDDGASCLNSTEKVVFLLQLSRILSISRLRALIMLVPSVICRVAGSSIRAVNSEITRVNFGVDTASYNTTAIS